MASSTQSHRSGHYKEMLGALLYPHADNGNLCMIFRRFSLNTLLVALHSRC